MKNLHIQCEHPAIILNPQLKDLILINRNYHCNNIHVTMDKFQHDRWYYEFPYRKFSRIKHNITIDDIPLYYVIDAEGEQQPIFLVVPCGKCPICNERKANEWVTRSMCESQTSVSIPIFFTLTYNDFCLPKNGVRKGAMQRFMKRLRINIDRYCGFKSNIRYFICAEYGSNTKRPHYHGILWNLPLLQPEHVDDLIDKSWSFDTNKKFYDTVPGTTDKYGHSVFKYYEERDKRYRIKYGYTRTSICTDGRVRYAMKYMRKDCDIPYKQNDIFFLSSRRGGIGAHWIESKLDEYRKNPQLLDVQLTDIWSGENYRGILPKYFKTKICPYNSLIIKKEYRDTFKLWNYWSNKFNTLVGHEYTPNARVLSHYPTLPFHHACIYDGEAKRLKMQIELDEKLQCQAICSYEYKDALTRDMAKIIEYLEWKLLQYEYDVGLSIAAPQYKVQHMKYVEKYIDNQPVFSVPDKLYSIRHNRLRSRQRELF